MAFEGEDFCFLFDAAFGIHFFEINYLSDTEGEIDQPITGKHSFYSITSNQPDINYWTSALFSLMKYF